MITLLKIQKKQLNVSYNPKKKSFTKGYSKNKDDLSLPQHSIHSVLFVIVSPALTQFSETLQQRNFFTIEVLHITYKINEFSAYMHFKLFTINKMKNKYNHLYLKMILVLSGDIELNPGPIDRNQIKKRVLKFLITKDSISCI